MAQLNEKRNCESPSAPIDAERQGQLTNVELVCPPCTTDRKLVLRIDTHVVPCLCLMYILAFLGMSPTLHSIVLLLWKLLTCHFGRPSQHCKRQHLWPVGRAQTRRNKIQRCTS